MCCDGLALYSMANRLAHPRSYWFIVLFICTHVIWTIVLPILGHFYIEELMNKGIVDNLEEILHVKNHTQETYALKITICKLNFSSSVITFKVFSTQSHAFLDWQLQPCRMQWDLDSIPWLDLPRTHLLAVWFHFAAQPAHMVKWEALKFSDKNFYFDFQTQSFC